MLLEQTRTLLSQIEQFRKKHNNMSEIRFAADVAKFDATNLTFYRQGISNPRPERLDDIRSAMAAYDREHPQQEQLTSSEAEALKNILGTDSPIPVSATTSEKLFNKGSAPKARWNKSKTQLVNQILAEISRRNIDTKEMARLLGVHSVTLEAWIAKKGMRSEGIIARVRTRLAQLSPVAVAQVVLDEPVTMTTRHANDMTPAKKIEILHALKTTHEELFHILYEYFFPGHG